MSNKILKFHRKAKCMAYKIQHLKEQGEEIIDYESPEAPVSSLDYAFNSVAQAKLPNGELPLPSLKDVVLAIKEMPMNWAKTMIVRGFDLIHDKEGHRQMQIYYSKAYRIGKVESEKTPFFRIDDVADKKDEKAAVWGDELRACLLAIGYAQDYIDGTREQMNLEGITHGTVQTPEDPRQTTMGAVEGGEPGEVESPDSETVDDLPPFPDEEKKPAKKATRKRKSDSRTK